MRTQDQDLSFFQHVAAQRVATEPAKQTSAKACRDQDLRSARHNFGDWQRGAQRQVLRQCVLTPASGASSEAQRVAT
eukprot:8474174-Pyramimonas_sp.AAC.1